VPTYLIIFRLPFARLRTRIGGNEVLMQQERLIL